MNKEEVKVNWVELVDLEFSKSILILSDYVNYEFIHELCSKNINTLKNYKIYTCETLLKKLSDIKYTSLIPPNSIESNLNLNKVCNKYSMVELITSGEIDLVISISESSKLFLDIIAACDNLDILIATNKYTAQRLLPTLTWKSSKV